jgi:hypothetical protein
MEFQVNKYTQFDKYDTNGTSNSFLALLRELTNADCDGKTSWNLLSADF